MKRWRMRRVFRLPIFMRRQAEQEVDEELSFHLAMRGARLHREGLSLPEADAESRRRFGDLDAIRGACLEIDDVQRHQERVGRFTAAVICDLRFAMRTLRRAPLFAVASVMSLGLAIGATIATFMIVDGLLLRPEPWNRPAELFLLGSRDPRTGEVQNTWSEPRFEEIRHATAGDVSDIASFSRRSLTLAVPGADSGARVDVEFASPTYLRLIGVRPSRGRTFGATTDGVEEVATTLMSARLERRLFPAGHAIGSTLRVNGVPLVVIGIMPDGFLGLSGTSDLWVPIAATPTVLGDSDALSPYAWAFRTVIRVPTSWTSAQRQRFLWNLEQGIGLRSPMFTATSTGRSDDPANVGVAPPTLALTSAADALTDRSITTLLWIVLGAACCVLVLACANVASLTIAKLTTRQTELAVRQALGASSLRLAGSLLVESSLVALAGVALGALLAEWVSRALWSLRPVTGGPMAQRLAAATLPSIDGRLLGFVATMTVVTVALLGLWPWLGIRRPLARRGSVGLSGRAASTSGRYERRVRGGLSTVQLGLAFLVTTSAVLLVASYRSLTRMNHGFASENMLTLRLDLPQTRYDPARATALYQALLPRLRVVPGVTAADLATALPLDNRDLRGVAEIDSTLPQGKGGPGTPMQVDVVGPGYFQLLGVRVAGSTFDRNRAEGGSVPVVISQSAAKRFWPGRNPIGQTIDELLLPSGWKRATVIGVAPDVQYGLPGAPEQPTIYATYADSPVLRVALLLKTTTDPEAGIAGVRAVLRTLDPQVVLYDAKTMEERIAIASSVTRFGALVLGADATVAFLIALIGVYSVIAFGVAQRRSELGIRMALGATPAMILTRVLRAGFWITASGLAVGALGSVAAHRMIASLLAGATVSQPGYYAIVLGAFVLAGLAASVGPAWSATRIDPARTLRGDT